MHDIWNPWHGCRKCSDGCQHCYMYFLDAQRGRDGGDIYRTKAGFRYPLSKDRSGQYKIKSGEMLRVCMTSDFFLEEADPWREEAWEIISRRPDVKYKIEGGLMSEQAHKSGLSFQGKPIDFKLTDEWGYPLGKELLYQPYFCKKCRICGMKPACNGCSRCGKC